MTIQVGELVWDEEAQALRTVPPREKRDDKGETLDAAPKPKPAVPCYCCGLRLAVVHMGDSVPACSVCYDRYRRRD
jgi:hypothetical protein